MADREQRLAIVVVAKDLATAALRRINGELNRLGHGRGPLAQATQGFGKLGAGLARVGVVAAAAAATGIVAAAKAGMDFEDAFAGVRKTVEGTPKELDGIYAELRKLATRIPVKFTDLAALATEAGALGVATPDIVRFTEVVARVSQAGQGLDPNQITEGFGKIGTILHMTAPDYERFGSMLIWLGNNAASTEGDILDVSRRFAAAGKQANLSAAQILGWSSSITSLGVLPEAGGSALSRLFNNMTRFAAMGDKKLTEWAKTAHMSLADFTKMVHDDANGAMLTFLDNLGKLDRFDAAKVLKLGGITNTRDINAVLLMSQSIKEVRRQIDGATRAGVANTALLEASGKRFNTLKNHLITFKNAILDAAVTTSEGMNPAIGRAVERLRALLMLPETQQDLKNLGRDIGEAIDSINWNAAIAGAKTLVGIMKTVVDIVRQIPPEITAAAVGFGAINRISGGLIGSGIGDIIGASLRAAIGQFIGRGSPANPMYVVPMGPGLGGGAPGVPGGPAGPANAAGEFSLIGSAAKAAGKLFLVVAAADLLLEGFAALNNALSPNVTPEQRVAEQQRADRNRARGVPAFAQAPSWLGQLPGQIGDALRTSGATDAVVTALRQQSRTLPDRIARGVNIPLSTRLRDLAALQHSAIAHGDSNTARHIAQLRSNLSSEAQHAAQTQAAVRDVVGVVGVLAGIASTGFGGIIGAAIAGFANVVGAIHSISFPNFSAQVDAAIRSGRQQQQGPSGDAGKASTGPSKKHPGGVGGRASGGSVWPGSWLLGERGPERLDLYPGGGGYVTPLSGGSAQANLALTIPIAVTATYSARDASRVIRTYRAHGGAHPVGLTRR